MCLTCVTTAGDFDTSAVELGILDFGNSINFRLVGDATWAADFKSWHAAADGTEPVVPGDDDDDDDDPPVPGDDDDDDDDDNVVDMSAGEDYTATDGVVDVFRYELDSTSGRAVGKDGEVSITGFTVGEDRIEFVDVEAGTLTDANFTTFPGVSLAENPFADNTSIAFDPDAGVSNIIIIAGIQDAALDTIDFAVV